MRRGSLFVTLLLATGVVLADDTPKPKPKPEHGAGADTAQTPAKEDPKELSGMSILGNQEAPKALVIVPWKSSQIGSALGISPMLDDSRQPVDKEVFMRALSYYEIRSDTTRHDGAPAGGRDTAAAERNDAAPPATAAHRR